MFCTKCGNKLEDSTFAFCPVCGAKISDEVKEIQNINSTIQLSVPNSNDNLKDDYELLSILVESNRDYYIKEFKKIDNGEKSFHWLYIVWPFMALYRKDFEFFKKYQLPFFIGSNVCLVLSFTLSVVIAIAGCLTSLIFFNKHYLEHLRKIITDNNLTHINNIDDIPKNIKNKVGVSPRYPLYFAGIYVGIHIIVTFLIILFFGFVYLTLLV